MSKHSMQDCIEKAEKQLREANNNSSIEIMSDLAWSTSDENCYREMSIDLEFYNIKKNGQFSKKLKKIKNVHDLLPFLWRKKQMKLNWRDASKELPEDEIECLVYVKTWGEYFDVVTGKHYRYFETWAFDSLTYQVPVEPLFWIYKTEIPLPEDK